MKNQSKLERLHAKIKILSDELEKEANLTDFHIIGGILLYDVKENNASYSHMCCGNEKTVKGFLTEFVSKLENVDGTPISHSLLNINPAN